MEDVLKSLQAFLATLPQRLRSMLVKGFKALMKYRDPAAIYHYASMIGRTEYYDEPSPRWPGFFKEYKGPRIKLPEPLKSSGVDALEAIRRRRSRRSYRGPLSLVHISTILYYSVGITHWEYDWPLRAYPSAGALQPVEAYLVADRVEGIDPGIYHYDPRTHELVLIRSGSYINDLAYICLAQEHVALAPAALIYTIVYKRTASKYATRGYKYAHLDAGTVVENTYIVAEALGLATVAVGAFYDEELCSLLDIDCFWEFPVIVMPIGLRV